jgi:hypothetical protein
VDVVDGRVIGKVADGRAASSPGIVQEVFRSRLQTIPANEIPGSPCLDLSQPVDVERLDWRAFRPSSFSKLVRVFYPA